jgi:IS30 family transposase
MAAALSLVEREEIAIGLAFGASVRSIARGLGRSAATVSREVRRNNPFGSYGVPYRASHAEKLARRRRPRPRRAKLAGGPLRARVVEDLRRKWSPQQIAARLKREFPDQWEMRVSHEAIYQAIYLQARGDLRRELSEQVKLRSGRRHRRSQAQVAGAVRSNRPWLGLNISERPVEAADRAVPGHWEGDLLIGARGASAVATLVERSTRFCLVVALPESRVSAYVADQLAQAMRRLPDQLRRSLTWDQGAEMASHAKFTLATDCQVFFCDPHSPWQRGSNENTNGLLREYWPTSKTDFRQVSQDDCDAVALSLNTRPRQTLGWDTPAERLDKLLVASTS